MKRVVLAYSGGLDTSVAIHRLTSEGWDVIAVAADVGQTGDLEPLTDRAEALGAVDARLVDARQAFADGFVMPALAMNARYQGVYPLVSALSRPLISQILIDVARETGAEAVAHGCTGKGNDQVRFEVSLGCLEPTIQVLAPIRDWQMSRDEALRYVEKYDLDIETTKSSPYSVDENLWGRSIECGVLEDPWHAPPEDIYRLTASADEAKITDIAIAFEHGRPVAVDGVDGDLLKIISLLETGAGAAGTGRVDMIEDRFVGIKSREIYEAPAALTLIAAHNELESLTLERDLLREKRRLEQKWAELVYEGFWFSPLRTALDGFAATTQPAVNGEVVLRVAPGGTLPIQRRSTNALYDHDLATYEDADSFNHEDANGFIRIAGLSARRWAEVQRG